MAQARLRGNKKTDEFFLGELSTKVDGLADAVREAKVATERRMETFEKAIDVQKQELEEHKNDNASRFASIEKHIWMVVGMGILLTFLVALASLGYNIYKGSQTIPVQRVIDVEKALKEGKEK